MADVTKYHLISPASSSNGSPFKSILKNKSLLLSSFFLLFVSFTLYLTLAPSSFTSLSTSTSNSSSGSIPPDLSSYYFPDSRSPSLSALPDLPPPVTATPPAKSSPPPPPLKPVSVKSNFTASLSEKKQGGAIGGESNATAKAPMQAPAKSAPPPPKPVSVKSNFTASLSEKKQGGAIGGESNATAKAKAPIQAPVVEKAKKVDMLGLMSSCDLYDGAWVWDDSYPLYKPGSCKLIDEQFNCFANKRPDNGYFKYRWKPKGCTIPRLNGGNMLKLLRGKRVVFVGDSLNRNMWESLICILRSSAKDPKRVFEAQGNLHFRTEAAYSFVFKDYNFTLEFFASPFLVRQWELKEKDKDGKPKETLRLDMIAESAGKFKKADILIFNTGHWWTHWKTSSGKDYYQEGSHVYPELNVAEAYRKAITTWARWVDSNIDTKTHVLFRGYSNSHFSGGQWNSGGACDNQTEPIKNTTYLTEYPWKDKVVEKVIKQMKTPVSYLNVTMLTDFRKDGHPSIYRKLHITEEERQKPMQFQDCSHWCLPGVPDSWNELLYAELLIRQYKQQQEQQNQNNA